MDYMDLTNGSFEMIGSVMLSRNVWQLYTDKIVRGVHWWATAFFASWGFWNLGYYPSLDQWFSFTGGVVIVLVNTVWLGQMFYYNRKERQGFQWRTESIIEWHTETGKHSRVVAAHWG